LSKTPPKRSDRLSNIVFNSSLRRRPKINAKNAGGRNLVGQRVVFVETNA